MKAVIKSALLFVLLNVNAFAWEVSTHETITKTAVTGKNRVENLNNFIDTFKLRDEDYKSEGSAEFYYADGFSSDIKLSGSYISIIKKIGDPSVTGKDDLELDPKIQEGKYVNLMQAGAILEDTQMKSNIVHARFNRHFYDPSQSSSCSGLDKTIAGFRVTATCAKIWALEGDEDPNMNYNLSKVDNDFSWKSIVGTTNEKGYLLNSILAESSGERKTAQANLFVSLGFLSHLMEDMEQAAHVRNDAHGGAFYVGGVNEFEIWGNKNFNHKIQESVSYNLALNAPTYNPTSFDSLFTTNATWTNKNFFSDDTTPDEGTHTSPANSVNQSEILTQYFGHNYYVLTSTGLDIPDGTNLLYYIDRVGPSNLYTLVYDVPQDVKDKGYDKYSILKDNAKHVFPRAVSAVEGMINYLFRGRVYAYVDPDDSDKLIIKNITNQSEIASGLDTAFRSDTKVYIYYETNDGKRLPLPSIGETSFSTYGKTELVNNDTISISGLSNAVAQATDMNDDKTIIVVLEGQMGGNGVGEKVIAGTKLVFKNNVSLLLSFDDSGSMGSKIEDAKQSALNMLPLLEGNENSLVEVQAFNRSGISFTSDMDAVRSKISSLYSSGGTPLYSSIISAANSCITEKSTHPSNKVIIVLYTDGIAGDTSYKQSAIDAISTANHPEIDNVYLVFINTGDLSGKDILADVALRANRDFIYLNSADQLATELQKVLQ